MHGNKRTQEHTLGQNKVVQHFVAGFLTEEDWYQFDVFMMNMVRQQAAGELWLAWRLETGRNS